MNNNHTYNLYSSDSVRLLNLGEQFSNWCGMALIISILPIECIVIVSELLIRVVMFVTIFLNQSK